MIMVMMTVDTRVDNGVRLLDRYGPDRWRDRMDTEALDIGLGGACVLGQLFDDWELGQSEMALRGAEDAVFYGFLPARADEDEQLTASWRSLLLGTRSPGTPPCVQSEDDVRSWQCGWQTAYGLPGDRFCVAPRGAGGSGDEYCPEHERDFIETYPHLTRD